MLAVYRQLETLYVYSHLKTIRHEINTNTKRLYASFSLLAEASEAVAWFEPELLTLSDQQIAAYFEAEPKLTEYRHYIQQMLDNRPHILPAEQEALLAGAGEIFGAASNTFSVLNNADLVFPVITDSQGEQIQLSHGVYGQLLESTDRTVRKAAYQGLYQVYEQFRNTLPRPCRPMSKPIITGQKFVI